jgi:hypothetical protein
MKAAGVFQGVDVNCSELSVFDIYKIDIYDKDFKKP